MALLPALSKPIIESLPVEQITQELQAKRLEKAMKNSSSAGSQIGAISDDISLKSAETGATPPDSNNNTDGGVKTPAPESSDGVTPNSTINSLTPTKTRSQLWSELKILSITRLIALIYSTSLLVLFTRLQINLISRKSYMESAIELTERKNSSAFLDSDNFHGDDYEYREDEYATEQMYLSYSWWLLNRGWMDLRERVKDAVENVFGGINPRTELTLDEFAILISRVQVLIEGPNVEECGELFANNLLPTRDLESFVLTQSFLSSSPESNSAPEITPQLRILLDETLRYIQLPSTGVVINKLVSAGISKSLELLANATASSSSKSTSSLIDDYDEVSRQQVKLKLASILASTTRQANLIPRNTHNEFVDAMDNVNELAEFSAIVYSNFDWSNE